jgi:hypothetical protein
MSVETPTTRGGTGSSPVYDEGRGDGWVAFAGVMLMIVGTINFIGGIAALDDSSFYVGETRLIFDDLNTWGWFLLATGVAQVLAAIGIWTRSTFATILGVAFASANIVVQLLMFSAFPLWSMSIIAIDVLVIYGLLAYGGKQPARS